MKRVSIIFFLLFSLSVFGENARAVSVTVAVQDEPLSVLFSQIESQTGLTFSYKTGLVNPSQKVTYSASDKNVKKVITDVFEKRVSAKIIGRHIVLVAGKKDEVLARKEFKEQMLFKGTVSEAFSNKNIAKVSIYEIKSRQSVLSDSTGYFEMVIEKGNVMNFNVARTGYQDTIVSVNVRENDSVNIILRPFTEAISMEQKKAGEVKTDSNANFVHVMVPDGQLVTAANLAHVMERRPVQISLIPRVGTNLEASGIIENTMSLNVLGGYNGAVRGVEVGGIFNILTRGVYGVQVGGVTNFVHGKVNGVQVAGVNNYVGDTVSGFQVSGVSNIVDGGFDGLQVSGVHNHASDRVIGMQVSGVFNWCKDTLNGMQVTGVGNFTHGKMHGMQVAGVFNMATQNVSGMQVSAVTNQALKNMNGVQVGLINFAKQNNGVQIGLINVSDSSRGVAIGLINFVKNGYHPLELYGNEVLYTNLAFKSGVDHFYMIYTAGFRPNEPQYMGFGLGFGSKINPTKWMSLGLDLTATYVFEDEINDTYDWPINIMNRADFTLDLKYRRWAIIGGPSLSVQVTDLGLNEFGQYTSKIAVNPFYTDQVDRFQLQAWWGWKAGLRFYL